MDLRFSSVYPHPLKHLGNGLPNRWNVWEFPKKFAHVEFVVRTLSRKERILLSEGKRFPSMIRVDVLFVKAENFIVSDRARICEVIVALFPLKRQLNCNRK